MLFLRNFLGRKCCKGITENSQNIALPHWGVIISVAIGTFEKTLSHGEVFQLSTSSSTCEISWRAKLQKPRNVQHFQFCDHPWWPSSKAAFCQSWNWDTQWATHHWMFKRDGPFCNSFSVWVELYKELSHLAVKVIRWNRIDLGLKFTFLILLAQ